MLTIVCRQSKAGGRLFAIKIMGAAILSEFGEKVRKLRKERNMSQEDLSYKCHLHRTYIGMIERGEKNITLVNIEKIALGLEVNIKDLF